jgi:hypothetical protein
MGRRKRNFRGFSAKALRELREQMFIDSTNRRKNQEGCRANNIIKNEKSKLWQTQQIEKSK